MLMLLWLFGFSKYKSATNTKQWNEQNNNMINNNKMGSKSKKTVCVT